MEDEEFELLSLEKRHLEIIEALKLISESLAKEEQDSGVLEAILAQGEKLSGLIDLISKIPAPEVTVDINLEELKSSFENIKQEIIESNQKVVDTIENRLLPFSFDLIREPNGLTTSVKVNYKQANEIN
jgi:phosphomannomutase